MTHMFDETENGTNIQPKHSSLGHKLAFVGGFLSFLGYRLCKQTIFGDSPSMETPIWMLEKAPKSQAPVMGNALLQAL